ncbi:choline transporter [Acetobacter orientalis]|uniref:Choline transporter n=1 Tax=Acetobacter orientalis TaxID=146474 RepID=A0A2Z5ZG99_9PROT|nr:choline transporter [Acetobacter orientalis]
MAKLGVLWPESAIVCAKQLQHCGCQAAHWAPKKNHQPPVLHFQNSF